MASVLHGQIVLTPEYERLRRYEGTYADEGGGTLQIDASPRASGRRGTAPVRDDFRTSLWQTCCELCSVALQCSGL
jgi:hypothetical protein